MDGSQPINAYLSGNFAPVHSEDDFELEISGEIPSALHGAFYRNGPNPQYEPGGDYHWFGGDGMIHAFYLEGGKARYRNRYVRTPKYLTEHGTGRAVFGTFGNPITTEPAYIGQDSGVANTNIVAHAGKLLALEEGHRPTELDPATLETRGYRQSYGGPVTAHPKIDPLTGEMVWFGYMAGAVPLNATVAYGVTSATGEVLRRDYFEAPFTSMVHDFLVTERHVLFPILPLTGSLPRVMTGGPAFAWEPDKGSHVGVMARNAGVDTIRWFTTDACYVFHPMNAWEEGDMIFADVMEYPIAPLFPNADGSRGQKTRAVLTRWTFDLAGDSHTIKREALDDTAGEFPRFDERRAGQAYRHGWFAAQTINPGGMKFNAIAHIDTRTGARTLHELPPGDGVGEPVFAPRAPGAAEGDGYLLALVHRAQEDKAEFQVFEATDIAAGPIGRAHVPRRVPYGFHGNWMAAS